MHNLNRPCNKVREVSKVIVNECIDRKQSLTCHKLQQLLILMNGIYLERYGKSLFPEDIKVAGAFKGLYIPNIEISSFIELDGDLSEDDKLKVYIAVLLKEQEVIDYVLDNYGMLDAQDLRNAYAMTRIAIRHDSQDDIISNNELEESFIKYGYSNLDEKKYEYEIINTTPKEKGFIKRFKSRLKYK